jgi:catechol 2,3-dioxygenase-like lactoylglutathione lyase family enzyme
MNSARPELDQINLVSGDPEASIAFYRRLGVEIPEDGVWRTPSGVHHVNAGRGRGSLGIELDSVALARLWNRGWRSGQDLPGRVVLGFKLPSRSAVDTVYADMTGAGYVGLQAPYDAFWGSRYAVIEDPDGIAVGIMSPPSSEYRSSPPEV